MSVFTCNSKKENFKNLTIGQRYTGVELDNNIVEITNDSGSIARYAKRYFTEEHITSETTRVQPTLHIRTITVAEYIRAHLEIRDSNTEESSGSRHEKDICIDYIITPVTIYNSNISCGIVELEGLESIIERLDDIKDDISENRSVNVSPFDNSHLFYVIMQCILDHIRDYHPSAFVICSTLESERPIFNEFNELAESKASCHSGIANNPNSRNDIKVWVIDMTLE